MSIVLDERITLIQAIATGGWVGGPWSKIQVLGDREIDLDVVLLDGPHSPVVNPRLPPPQVDHHMRRHSHDGCRFVGSSSTAVKTASIHFFRLICCTQAFIKSECLLPRARLGEVDPNTKVGIKHWVSELATEIANRLIWSAKEHEEMSN
jgi:hypothetical protein